ncbi:MAG: hypothetical protein ACOY6E_04805 [Pseudomonadota bacterium]
MADDEVEPLGLGVEFQKAAALAGVADEAQSVELDRLALAEFAAAGVGQQVEMGVIHDADETPQVRAQCRARRLRGIQPCHRPSGPIRSSEAQA